MVGQQLFHLLCPFSEAVFAAVEVLFISDIVGFFGFLESIEIKMIYRTAIPSTIDVDDGECGAAHIIGHAKLAAQLLDKGCLAHAHFAKEGKETLFGKPLQECLSHLGQLCGVVKYLFQNISRFIGLKDGNRPTLSYLSLSAARTFSSSFFMERWARKSSTTPAIANHVLKP